jgi:hypothetical protein
MKILVLKPNELSKVVEVSVNDFKAMRDIVDGYIQTILLDEHALILMDEDGLRKHLPFCRAVQMPKARIPIVGTCIVVGYAYSEATDEDDFTSLTDAQIEKYQLMLDKEVKDFQCECEKFDHNLIDDLLL